jgi:hypothetical protein
MTEMQRIEVKFSPRVAGYIEYRHIKIGQFFQFGGRTYQKIMSVTSDSAVDFERSESIAFGPDELVHPIIGEFTVTIRQQP